MTTKPCLICGWETEDPRRICSIACQRKVRRAHGHASGSEGGCREFRNYNVKARQFDNTGSYKPNFTIDSQEARRGW